MTIPLPPSHGPVGGQTEAPVPGALEEDTRGLSLWRGAWQRLRRNPTAIAGALIVLAFVVIANRRHTDLYEWGRRTTALLFARDLLASASFTEISSPSASMWKAWNGSWRR